MEDTARTTDLAFLRSFTGGNTEKMAKYVNMFLNHAPALIASMEESLTAGNYPQLRSAVHSLKPQLSYMGAKKAEELAKQIEYNAAEQVNLESIPQQVSDFKLLYEQASEELKNELKNF